MSDLHTAYRPKTLDEVVGQAHVVKALKSIIAQKTSRAILLVGPTGTGKTTIARIIASMVGATGSSDLLEVDGATTSGIDDVRGISDLLNYRPMSGNGTRVVVIDECHGLSKSAWTALLKSVEEPPPGVYWVFCTTDPAKVPGNIANRCTRFDLKKVQPDVLFELLKRVNSKAKVTTSEDVLYLIAERCDGSPRLALTMLAKCHGIDKRKVAAKVLESVEDTEGSVQIIDLCRVLVRGATWATVQPLLNNLAEENPEAVRQVVLAYFEKVLLGAKTADAAQRAMAVIDAFSVPYPAQRGAWPVALSVGRLIF